MKNFKTYLKENLNDVRCGVIITNGIEFLIAHATGLGKWDIPKGGMNDNESQIETAIRELEEETNIKLKESDLKKNKRYNYLDNTDLIIFIYETEELPKISKMKCKSKYEDGNGIMQPEMDEFKYITWDEAGNYLVPQLVLITDQIKEKYTIYSSNASDNASDNASGSSSGS